MHAILRSTYTFGSLNDAANRRDTDSRYSGRVSAKLCLLRGVDWNYRLNLLFFIDTTALSEFSFPVWGVVLIGTHVFPEAHHMCTWQTDSDWMDLTECFFWIHYILATLQLYPNAVSTHDRGLIFFALFLMNAIHKWFLNWKGET